MREILFRGKRIDNGEWVYGSLIRSVEFYGEMRDKPKYYICPFTTTFEYDECSNDSDEVNPETVGQYTGLKERDGTKIFEGDIVEVIIYHDIGCYPYSSIEKEVVKIPDFYRKNIVDYIEVIDNIHDNPELLGVTNEKI